MRTVSDAESAALYGQFQHILAQRDGEDAGAEAQAYLEDNGLQQTMTVECLGDPELISGSAVLLRANTTGVTGLCWIDSDTHTWKNGQYFCRLSLNFRSLTNEVEAGRSYKKPPPRSGDISPRGSPAKRVPWGKEEQGSAAQFRRWRKQSGADFATTWTKQKRGAVASSGTVIPRRPETGRAEPGGISGGAGHSGRVVSRRGVTNRGAVVSMAVSHFPEREVMRMGNGRWARALRCVVVFLAVLWLLVYIGPNAC
ncbi:hypothetical protein M5E87_21380 [Flavonifractor plautii]|nr:hypothetical protein M5E87_21380 [Flavonifractor plautii]